MRAVAKLEHGGDQIDGDGSAKLHRVVQCGFVNVADEKPKLSAGEDDEETEDDFRDSWFAFVPDLVTMMASATARSGGA